MAGHLGHHLLSLVEALNKLVDLGNADTRTISNALAARSIENLRILALLRRHTANNRLDAVQLLFIHHGGHFIHLLAAGHHLQQVADGAHLADHQHLLKEVIERQLARAQLRGCFFGFLVVQGCFSLLDKGEQITHAQNAAGHALRVEDIEIIELLTGRGVHDGLARNLADRQGRTTAGVTVQLGENNAGKVHAIAEGLGRLYGVLADHGVDDKEDFVRVDGIADIARLRHQCLIDAQAASGIDDDHIVLLLLSLSNALLGDVHRVTVRGTHFMLVGVQGGSRIRCKGRHLSALADDLQLLYRAWALQVTGHQHRGVALLSQVLGQLTGQGGFTSTLQAGKHDHRRRVLSQVQAAGFTAEDLNELLIDDLDYLLRRVERLRDFRAAGAFLDALDKATDDGQRHVGFQQREADLASGGIDISLGQFALTAQARQG